MSFSKINYKDNETIITADNLNDIQDAILEGYQPDGTIEAADFAPNAIVEAVYPIGSIYMSVNDISPAMQFGGTWEQIKDRFILAAGNSYIAGAIGGEATHTLTINKMPSHNHSKSDDDNLALNGINGKIGRAKVATGTSTCAFTSSDVNGLTYGGNTASTGGGAAHNNMPPYLVAYMWKRIA